MPALQSWAALASGKWAPSHNQKARAVGVISDLSTIIAKSLIRLKQSRCHTVATCLPALFSRKHGEGFFRWVHLSCSHEIHYKVSLQGIIIMKVNARSHCKESLQGVIARSHCKESLQGVIARSHCKESLQGVMRVIASCAWSQVKCKELSASCKCKESGASCKCWSQVQVASAGSQVQVASARSQVQLTCEELKSLLRAAG